MEEKGDLRDFPISRHDQCRSKLSTGASGPAVRSIERGHDSKPATAKFCLKRLADSFSQIGSLNQRECCRTTAGHESDGRAAGSKEVLVQREDGVLMEG